MLLEETNELIVCPGVYDGLSARTAIEVGFNGLYMTGAGTTASRLGQPDLAIAQLHDMKENADMIANLDPFGPPLIADMDTGYGGPVMVARTIEHYIRAGVAAAHLEDQVLTKRCGHLSGKKVVSKDEYLSRIRAAHLARLRTDPDFVLIARTDALQSLGYDECIDRLKAARDIGADVGLLEGFASKEQAARAVKELAPWPLLLNSVENGHSPTITVDEAREMGFRIIIFSFATLAPAYVAIKEVLERLKSTGAVGTAKDITPVKLFNVCGLKHAISVDTAAGGTAFAGGV
ncbi:oxaloacetate Acetylhydrolase [Macrophomina phaseolina]|nr:oxaloacetate Acetylhydrolase [Macrophomina phaseolina]